MNVVLTLRKLRDCGLKALRLKEDWTFLRSGELFGLLLTSPATND